ncbi:MAG: hypothetical protein AAGC93_24620 [Cyanobacteria bacterium P01_F01_bin.53]
MTKSYSTSISERRTTDEPTDTLNVRQLFPSRHQLYESLFEPHAVTRLFRLGQETVTYL